MGLGWNPFGLDRVHAPQLSNATTPPWDKAAQVDLELEPTNTTSGDPVSSRSPIVWEQSQWSITLDHYIVCSVGARNWRRITSSASTVTPKMLDVDAFSERMNQLVETHEKIAAALRVTNISERPTAYDPDKFEPIPVGIKATSKTVSACVVLTTANVDRIVSPHCTINKALIMLYSPPPTRKQSSVLYSLPSISLQPKSRCPPASTEPIDPAISNNTYSAIVNHAIFGPLSTTSWVHMATKSVRSQPCSSRIVCTFSVPRPLCNFSPPCVPIPW